MIIPEFKFALREDLKNQDGFIPQRAEPDATGWDVRCAEPNGVIIKPLEYKIIRLGIRMFAPDGWWLELRPRSSSHAKKYLNCLYGVIDQLYEREIGFSCQYIPQMACPGLSDSLVINFGERIGQVIPVQRQIMLATSIDNEEFDRLCKERGGQRGTGGFGSTG